MTTTFVTGTDDLDPHYKAEVLADSVSPDGVRLTTFRLTYPRFIHSEMMTHRVFSRNAASSRAIPTERLIDQVRKDPFVPATFNARVAGMGVGEELDEGEQAQARNTWRIAARNASNSAEELLHTDKSRANRLLEPFLWYTAIFTGTEWDNFLALRDHEGAQPEIQAVARSIKRAFEASTPAELEHGQWHLPLVTREELAVSLPFGDHALETAKKVSASRCARISYDRFDEEPLEKTIERAEVLMGNGHFSPFEHVARPMVDDDVAEGSWAMGVEPAHSSPMPGTYFCGNFRGWVQFRKEIANESRFDLAQATTS